MASEFPLTCKVPEAWLIALDDHAQAHGLTRNDTLKMAIAQFLNLEDPYNCIQHLEDLDQTVAKLGKQIQTLHKRLKVLETQPEPITPEVLTPYPQARLSFAPPAITTLEGEVIPPNSPSARLKEPERRFGAIRLDELCRVTALNLSEVQAKAVSVGISIYEAIEIETGWQYDPQTATFAPPL